MSRAIIATLTVTAVLFCPGCPPPSQLKPFTPKEEKDYNRPLPPGALALRKIDPKDYPDFAPGFEHRAGLEEAIQNSLTYLAKPSSEKYFPYGDVSHERAVASLERFRDLLHQVRSGPELNQAIRTEFDVYQSVGCDDAGTVWFTGYYTPIFDGRRQRDARFKYPIYKRPPDLVSNEEGITLGRRRPDGQIVPYHTRQQIEQGGVLDGWEIAWLKDPFEAYVVTVQGSAKLRVPGEPLLELGYAGNNGYEYSSVAQALVRDKVIRPDEVSLQTLLRYFAAHPEDVHRYTWQNKRTVFFTERAGGPFGSLNVPVLPYRSIATDKEVFPRACLAFIRTDLPIISNRQVQTVPYSGFMLDQDTGGAIRAAGRCDVFMGIGAPAEATAGRTGAEGGLYYIFTKQGATARRE